MTRPAAACLLAVCCAFCAPDSAAPARPAAPVDVVELSAAGARDRMSAGTLTARVLTEAYLARIRAIDAGGQMLNAVIELNPNAAADAAALDAERLAGKTRGPMHGIPVLIKDNVDVAGLVNSAGSLAMAAHRPKQDAAVVQRLRERGAVILGKTNLSEWANFRSTRSTSGWSSRGGQTKNPYVLDRNPCGSSSGTGTAIAASLAAIGVGTETDGSIICPSSVAGLVGLKPTVGLVSRRGIIPISASQDTAGPMARTVTDAALMLGAMADRGADYTPFLRADALKGKRFGVLRQAMGYHPDVDAAADTAMAAMKTAGAELIDIRIRTYNEWDPHELEVLLFEFKDGLNRYLAESGAALTSLEALIAWNTANADRAMPFFGQELFERAQAKGPLSDGAYITARDTARRLAGKDGLLATLDQEQLDAIVAPSMSPAWPTDHVLGDHFVGAGYGMAAVAGTPSITVPVGESRGLPLGLTFMGRGGSEGDLLGFAFALEQLTKARRPPAFVSTLSAP